MKVSHALFLFFTAARATPVTIQPRQNEDLPLLKLPYGTWQATHYDADAEVYVFKNVRYAAAPTGDLRWAKPAPPLNETEIQDGSYGYSCYQSIPPSALSLAAVTGIPLIQKILGTGLAGQLVSLIPTNILSSSIDSVATLLMSSDLLTSVFLSIIGQLDVGSLSGSAPSGEDCLFLDLFVPRKAFDGGDPLPVVNYIYGGAYVTGTKEPIYDARPLVQQPGGNVIFVVGNYRLSALGFLGGSRFMKDGGTANAGFWDQRAVMQWIQDHISLVNGNPEDVSLWGESAGAGSVMHHLTAAGGTLKPLFKRAFVQSPWNVAKYDPTGNLDRQYDELVKALGCTGANRLVCLRGVPADTLRKAVDKIVAAVPFGQFGFGASVDGIFAKQLPALELSEGNFANDIESVIVTHNSDEASMFVPELVVDRPSAFEDELKSLYGDSPGALAKIRARYDISKYASNREQLIDYMDSSYFLCNVRNIAKAYAGKAWLGQYSRGTGKHGTDIRVLFFNATDGAPKDDPGLLEFAPRFQSYFISHAITGDVNTKRAEGIAEWPRADIGDIFGNVMDANTTFSLIEDESFGNEVCDFWLDVWRTGEN